MSDMLYLSIKCSTKVSYRRNNNRMRTIGDVQ